MLQETLIDRFSIFSMIYNYLTALPKWTGVSLVFYKLIERERISLFREICRNSSGIKSGLISLNPKFKSKWVSPLTSPRSKKLLIF